MSITLAGAAPGVATRIDPAPVVAGCVMFALVLFLPQVLNDGDTLWQIRTGEWILDHRAIPSADPFSFTAGNTPWFAHEWLAEVLMALAHRMGGMRGIMVLTAAASGLTAAVLLHHLRRFLPGIYAVLGLVLALSNAAPSLLARPHVLAWPCLALWCGGLVAARHLVNRGASVRVVLARPALRMSEAAQHQLATLIAMGAHCCVATYDLTDDELEHVLANADVVVDAVLGYRIHGAPRGEAERLIGFVVRAGRPVVSLDLPSGVDPDTGEAAGIAITATATLTLALPKPGLFRGEGDRKSVV